MCWQRMVTENHEEAQTGCVVFKVRLGSDGAETSDGFMDNGFIVQANCLRIQAAWCVWRKGIRPISVSHWRNVWQQSSVQPGCMEDTLSGWEDKQEVVNRKNVKAGKEL